MPSYVTPKKGVQFIMYLGLPSQATPETMQSNPTLAAGDVKVSIDGGALANLATLPAVTPASSKMVKMTLSTSEMNGDNVTVVFSDASGAEWSDVIVNIQTSARQIDDLAYPATSGRSMVVDASGLVDANMVKAGPSGSGTAQTAGDIVADTNDIQTRLPAALVSGRMDASVGAMAANVLTATAINADAFTAAKFAADVTTEFQAGLATAAALAVVDGIVDDILVDTAVIGAAGAGLTAVPWNAAWDAEVQSDVTDALNAYDPPTSAELVSEINAVQADIAALTIPSAASVADAVWEEPIADHSGTAGSTAEQLAAAGSAGDPWATALPGAYSAGQAGKIVGDNLNATVGSRASQTSVDDLPTNAELATALAGADDAVLAAIGALTIPSAADNAAAVLAAAFENAETVQDFLRLSRAALYGKASGLETTTAVFRDAADTKARITATVDASGNRTAVTIDAA